MRQDKARFDYSHSHVDKRGDALREYLVANGCLHLESRVGSCAYGIRWRFGSTSGQRICGEQAEWEEGND